LKKLIYILNHYSESSPSHFFHVINLLEKIADQKVIIKLIIEKCDSTPALNSSNIELIPLRSSKCLRPFSLFRTLIKLNRKGYKKVFIRISWRAALIAIITSFFTKQKTYFWHSTQGSIEHYNSLKPGIQKLLLFLKFQYPFKLVLKGVSRLVTGPESMAEYYSKNYGIETKKIEVK